MARKKKKKRPIYRAGRKIFGKNEHGKKPLR